MNETEVDVQPIEHLDFKPPCDYISASPPVPCHSPADVAVKKTCCGAVAFLCLGHLTHLGTPTRRCRACGTVLPSELMHRDWWKL